jgi:hypothetical protein
VYAEPLLMLLSCNPTGLSDSLTAVKDLLQGDGPIGEAVRESSASLFKHALSTAGPLVVRVGEALPYVKEIIPILKTLVDMYKERGILIKECAELTEHLDQIQVYIQIGGLLPVHVLRVSTTSQLSKANSRRIYDIVNTPYHNRSTWPSWKSRLS